MKIVSDFRDYYDFASRFGVDADVVYVRKTKYLRNHPWPDDLKKPNVRSIRLTRGNDPRSSKYRPSSYRYRGALYTSSTLIFCGKMFCALSKSKDGMSKFVGDQSCERDLFASKQEVVDDLSDRLKGDGNWMKFLDRGCRVSESDYFTWIDVGMDFHRKMGSPVILIHNTPVLGWELKYDIILNPILKNNGFSKVIPPHEAHQNIYQTLTLMGRPVPDIVEISNKDRIHKHGFDEWSFRKKVR